MKKRSIKAVFLTILLSLSLLSGCGKEEEYQDVTTRQHNPISTASTDNTGDTGTATLDTTENSTTEEPTAEAPSGIKITDKAKLISTDTLLYEITDLIPEKDDMIIMDIAADGNGNLLILYQNTFFTEGTGYSVDCLNLASGEITTLYDKEIIFSEDARDVAFCTMKFVSVDPLVIYEAIDRRYYFPDTDFGCTDSVDELYYPQNVFSYAGKLYANTSAGTVYRTDVDNGVPSVTILWEAPNSCEAFGFEKQNGYIVTLSAYPKYKDTNTKVYFDIDLKNGTLLETYTTEDIIDYCLSHTTDANIYAHYMTSDESYIYIRRSDETMLKLFPAGDDELTKYLRKGYLNVKSGDFSLSEDGFVFFAGNSVDIDDYILFWDTSCTEPETYTETRTPYKVVNVNKESTEAYAKELSEKFDVDIHIYLDGMPNVFDYDIYPEEDYASDYRLLALIDTCYSKYPEGFLAQLGGTVPLRIYLANAMVGSGDNTVASAAGLVNTDEYGNYIFFSTFSTNANSDTIYHETMHVIYNNLVDNGFFFDYQDQWFNTNPPDFEYGYTYNADELPSAEYTSENLGVDPDINNVYFISPYSKTYMTEEIATLMGALLSQEVPPRYFTGVHMQEKCNLLFEIIRKGFDTTGWPEKVFWEEQLQKAIDSNN
ncbi:MAG: hypothetical protein IJJ74_11845 [Eubacterium sp.]|nr:hypothetical protein [Eubacterium sp.]